jgi:DNA polymerase
MARQQTSPAEARALLEWQLAMGADEAICEEGIDRFALAAAPPAPLPETTAAPPARGGDAITSARAAAAAATTLDELRAALESFEGCALKQTATRLVFADGTPGARVMLVGEAPGRDEDMHGLPFVGRSGQLLDRMLAAIGLDRGSVYIANVIPWRPPGNRTPTPQEVQVCLPFIQRQIELAAPETLVFLGGAAASALTGATDGIGRLRGRWLGCRIGEREFRALAMFHPAYLLRTPLAKRLAWRDLLALHRVLDGA